MRRFDLDLGGLVAPGIPLMGAVTRRAEGRAVLERRAEPGDDVIAGAAGGYRLCGRGLGAFADPEMREVTRPLRRERQLGYAHAAYLRPVTPLFRARTEAVLWRRSLDFVPPEDSPFLAAPGAPRPPRRERQLGYAHAAHFRPGAPLFRARTEPAPWRRSPTLPPPKNPPSLTTPSTPRPPSPPAAG